MELIDKYIYAIGKQLPADSKEEIKRELKSLLLDEIESSYGSNPTQEEIEKTIYEFGSPKEVAARYKKDNIIIAKDYTDIYFLLIKILIGAMAIAFAVIFVVDLFTNFENFNLLKSILKFFGNVFTSSLSAIGALTLVFILISRCTEEIDFEMDKPWSISDLDNVDVDVAQESKLELGFGIFFSIVALALINVFPNFMSFLERSFERSQITLGHHINIPVFKEILIFITIVWTLEIILLVIKFIVGNTKYTSAIELLMDGVSVGLLIFIVQNKNLYLDYRSLLGFRGIFVFVLVVSIIDLIASLAKFIKHYVVEANI